MQTYLVRRVSLAMLTLLVVSLIIFVMTGPMKTGTGWARSWGWTSLITSNT